MSEDWEKDFDLDMTEEEVQMALSKIETSGEVGVQSYWPDGYGRGRGPQEERKKNQDFSLIEFLMLFLPTVGRRLGELGLRAELDGDAVPPLTLVLGRRTALHVI